MSSLLNLFLKFREENKIDLLMMSNEAHFHMHGFVNKQIFRHWATENSQMTQKNHTYAQRVTVWCAIMHDCVIDPYFFFFFENEEVVIETANGERCRNMLNTFFAPIVEQMANRNELSFHTSNASLQLLH